MLSMPTILNDCDTHMRAATFNHKGARLPVEPIDPRNKPVVWDQPGPRHGGNRLVVSPLEDL